MLVRIDKTRCCECGLCTKVCPQVFYVGKKGTLVRKGITEISEKLLTAARECPKQAIVISEEDIDE